MYFEGGPGVAATNKLFSIILLAGLAFPAQAAGDQAATATGLNLPPKLRGLLILEMNALLDASKTILDALVKGQHDVVAGQAQAIHDSFILKREMTAADREDLRNSVPDAFIQRDRDFHEISARLAGAARMRDQALQQKLFADMLAACAACHSQYAVDRFPGFNADE
jgi:hypothetical protein